MWFDDLEHRSLLAYTATLISTPDSNRSCASSVLKHWRFLSVYLSVKLLVPVRGRCWISGMHTLPFFVLTSPLPLLFVAGWCCFPSEFRFLLKLQKSQVSWGQIFSSSSSSAHNNILCSGSSPMPLNDVVDNLEQAFITPFHRIWSPARLSSNKPSSSSPSSVALKQSQPLDREPVTAEFQTRFRTDRRSQFQSLNDAAKK